MKKFQSIKETQSEDVCGLCGLPGADKIPHPQYWPTEQRPNTNLVHSECENEECQRAHQEFLQKYGGSGVDKFLNSIKESKIVKKSQLKPLIKTVLREIYKKQLNEWSSGIEENYEIEFDSLVIPGLTTENDAVTVTINIEYEGQPGTPARGMFGPPENSSPAESDELNILDWDFVLLTITPEQGQPKEIDNFQTLSKEQFMVLKKAVNDYIEINEDKIEGEILKKLGNIEPDYPEPDREDDYFEDR